MITHAAVHRALRSEIWALHPAHAERLLLVAYARLQGFKDEAAAEENRASAAVVAARAANVAASSTGSVQVIAVFGTIMQRGNMMDISGPSCASTETIGRQIKAAVADPNVRAVVLDFDTPGGSVSGVQELYDIIFEQRGKKDIVACVDSLCASAGYYLAAACSSIWATPSSLTGSIGVYSAHEDDSAYLENQGIKITLIQYGDNKTLGNPYSPLDEAARAEMQGRVDSFGKDFDKAVAKGRGVTAAKVRSDFGQGKTFRASDAKAIGMVDKVGTLDDLLATYGVSRSSSGANARAAAEPMPVASTDDAERVAMEQEARERALSLLAFV